MFMGDGGTCLRARVGGNAIGRPAYRTWFQAGIRCCIGWVGDWSREALAQGAEQDQKTEREANGVAMPIMASV